jgi:amino acid transporter
VFLVLVMAVALPHAQAARLTPFAPHGWTALGPALIICFFGFIGWENAAPVAGEVVNPRRTFPRAIGRGVATVGFLYLSMALTVVLVLPRDAAGSQQITAFATVLQIASGHALSQAGDMVAVVLLVLSMNAWTLATSRVVYSQAHTGLLVTAGTLAFPPFSGVSMLYAAAIAILAAGLEYSATWTAKRRNAATCRSAARPLTVPARCSTDVTITREETNERPSGHR